MLQSDICNNLVMQLKKYISSARSIVDLGCGTGNSTKQLIDNFVYEKIYAVDIADKLLAKAEHKLAQHNVDILHADFEQTIFKNHFINLAFSNMSLQWSISFANTLETLYAQLADDSILAFSMPINNTFFELKDGYKNIFFTQSEISSMLLNSGFSIISSSDQFYRSPFLVPSAALQSIKMVGANCLLGKDFQNGLSSKTKLSKVFKREGIYSLTYHIGFFIAMKDSKDAA
jgi:malonyl-CoA O-methyltransferase